MWRADIQQDEGEVMNASFIRRAGTAGALLLILAIGAVSPAAAYTWSEILIPSIGPLGLSAGINDRGQVAVNNADNSKSGIYQHGTFTPLPAPPAGYSTVSAIGINNSGVITGGAFPPSDPTHEQGYVLVGSHYTFFSRPGWSNTEGRAIGPSGLVTGYNYDDAFTTCAGFVYNPASGVFTDATAPGSTGCFSTAQGINASGRITGDGRQPDGTGRYGFIWQQGTLVPGGHTLAPFLAQIRVAGANTAARGINDAGVIVGFTNAGFGFVGSDSRGFEVLIPPGGDASGVTVACGGINNFRQVVCQVTDSAGNTRGFIGTPGENEQ
ncbi:MAG TPA: hypothetical protein VMT09_07515 [Steroidobacteraceae bacterium]|nr:hypothetical protein [Steroidobacteraceae bacterium]